MVHSLFTWLSIAAGGAIGACLRFALSTHINKNVIVHQHLQIGTLMVNVIGSAAMGIMYVLITEKAHLHPDFKGVLMVGLLGAFTTFSTFSIETINFIENGHPQVAIVYVLASVLLSIAAAWVAIIATRMI
ncbi:Putative fluoride ion transporter CrcB [Sinobacterium norvegicum]|uniref:Fluoride-specific ion channel FluC n=1 Tax=Sinobacterium norvegicum TaxID=1641715 RepID=A0ABM9ABF0_9GAMM|nr:fluoride efflux transporter CrcB [Sinobacterium norvegicum]CAH0990315.1 Putative fluoride ion transporter CrcB [Sinobacterium norvegicum]